MSRDFGNFETGETSDSGNEVETSIDNNEENNEIDDFLDKRWEDEDKESSEEDSENGVRKISCIREDLEGKTHPETGVPYERKTVVVDGEKVEGVFPQFESKYDTKLPENLYKESDSKQFEYCSQQLKEAIQKDPKLAEQFTPRQYEQIMNGAPRISGYTWHHTENPGEMQLVDADIHQKTRHTGGRSVWGGGSDCR